MDWQVEVQAEARRWPVLLPPLLKAGVKVVTDHFGKPDPALGVDDSGVISCPRAIPAVSGSSPSGAYRNGDGPVGDRIAKAAIPLLRDNFGVDHFVRGSDWPHTQFESVAKYPIVRASLYAWLPDPGERRTVLDLAPVSLFKF